MTKKKFYVTTPIYYANGAPHLGGAYTTIAADVLARWNKQKGKEVFFLTGTDEHGQKIQEVAESSGKKPQEFVDEVVKGWKKAFKLLNIENDYFIRTTNPKHEDEVKKLLNILYKKGLIYKGNYESYYCVGCEQYLTKKDLIDGKCHLHNTEPELKKEEAYLFKLSSFKDKLKKLIETGEYEILPKKRRKEILTFLEGGLEDISISRLKEKISWGIPLPFDKDHVTWVWPDAFWNYVSGLVLNDVYDKFWPANVQLMAKDIFRVHATIWPALLLGVGKSLPKTLFVHGYFTINGKKMSKSIGNIIDPVELIKKYGADAVRYYMLRNIPFGDDGDVSEKALIDRHNNELANKLGNLVSRVSGLIEKNGVEKCENKLIKRLGHRRIETHFEKFEFDKVLNEIFAFVDTCNEYVQSKKPWETGDKKVLYELKESILEISKLLWAFIPETSEKITEHFSAKKITKSPILFEKIENNKINKDSEVLEIMTGVVQVNFEDWINLDLRVAEIKQAEDIEGADKLFKITLDVGSELGERIVCAGLKKFYKKEDLKGKKVIYFSNLKPRKMRGIESQGMILAASTNNHEKVILLAPEKDIENGSRVS